MTTYEPAEILQEMQRLISNSCTLNESEDGNQLAESMHIAIIKKYFNAHKVSVDYKNNIINVQVPITKKDFTNITLECQDMERFLKSCIQEDATSLSFYQNMLIYYNVERNVA